MSVRAGLPRMLKRTFLFLAALALTAAAHAQLTIDITTSGGRQIPIAIMPLAGDFGALHGTAHLDVALLLQPRQLALAFDLERLLTTLRATAGDTHPTTPTGARAC